MLNKIDYQGEPTYRVRNILKYSTNSMETSIANCKPLGVFMCRPMEKDVQMELAMLSRKTTGIVTSKVDKQFDDCAEFDVVQAVAEIFMMDLNNSPVIADIYSKTSINSVCASFERLMRYKNYDVDMMYGIYDNRRLYRNGRYYDIMNYFDSALDFLDKYPKNTSKMTIGEVCDYLRYAVRIRPGKIVVYSDEQAKKEFRQFHKENYADRSKIFKKKSFDYDDDMLVEIEHTAFPQLRKQKPELIEGEDYLKIVIPDDHLIIVFNTKVADEVWTVSTFKKYLKGAMTDVTRNRELRTCKDLFAIFMARKFDMDFTNANDLIYSSVIEENLFQKKHYMYELSAQGYSGDLAWQDAPRTYFKDEFEAFLKHIRKEKYIQMDNYSYQSVAYRDTFSFGSERECGYCVYTY